MIWLKLKAWGWAIAAALIGVLAGYAGVQKHRAGKFKDKAETLKATVNAERVRKEIEKKERDTLSLKEREIEEKVKKKDENFTGIDNLTNSNDF